jgi:hypothetical protein
VIKPVNAVLFATGQILAPNPVFQFRHLSLDPLQQVVTRAMCLSPLPQFKARILARYRSSRPSAIKALPVVNQYVCLFLSRNVERMICADWIDVWQYLAHQFRRIARIP